jgi:hypothetical protein
MRKASEIAWLVKCAAVVTVLLLGCDLISTRIGSSLQQPAVTTRDGSLITFNRYVNEPMPDVVLVGSSVSWRLKEEYFSLPHVRNLAIAGGSPVTGLAIVAKQRQLPKVVLVETNILSRAVDEALLDKFSGGERDTTLFVRPVRTAIAACEAWNHAPPTAAQARAIQRELLRQPPDTFDNQTYVARALSEMNDGDAAPAARANALLLKQLVADIERRGTRVFLVEIPFAAEIEGSNFVRVTSDVVHEAFPDPDRWLAIAPPQAELRWTDGLHLDERSALIVVQAIERALSAQLGRPNIDVR